jgi:hypothetical protein
LEEVALAMEAAEAEDDWFKPRCSKGYDAGSGESLWEAPSSAFCTALAS